MVCGQGALGSVLLVLLFYSHGLLAVNCLSFRGGNDGAGSRIPQSFAATSNENKEQPVWGLPRSPAATAVAVGGKGTGLEGTYQAIYEAPQDAAATENALTSQGVGNLFGTPGAVEEMLGRTDEVLDQNSAVAQPGIGKYFGNAAFFTKSKVTMDQAFAGVTARTDSDIEAGLSSVNNASLDENLEAEEEAVGAADPTTDLVNAGDAQKDQLFAPSGTLGSTLDMVDPTLGGAPSAGGSEFDRALRQVMP